MYLPAPATFFSAVILLLAATGCATPQYQTSVRLVPPSDAAGRACVEDCETKKIACQSGCQSRFQACIKELEPQVETKYAEALKQYEQDLKRYAIALRHYEMQLRLDWLHGYPYYHPYGWYAWPGPYFPPPYREPVMPTRDRVRAQLEKANCQADCGCLPSYDSCFVGCGGQKLSETVCVQNCPPAK